MKTIFLTPPGKFPTLIHDPGVMWSTVAQFDVLERSRVGLNAAWWKVLFSPQAIEALFAPLSILQKFRRRLEWLSQGLDVKAQSRLAMVALSACEKGSTYTDLTRYVHTVEVFSTHLSLLNTLQPEIDVSLFHGPCVKGLDYNSSEALVAYAQKDTWLYRLVCLAFETQPVLPADIVLMTATCPEDLLTALMVARCFREKLQREKIKKDLYLCLADHGYENFSLHGHASGLEASNMLTRLFDSVIVSKNERRVVLSSVFETLIRKEEPLKGFLTAAQLGLEVDASFTIYPYEPSPPIPIFSPMPVLWTRLSERRCYWSRCTFCVQNAKYDNPQPVSLTELASSIAKIERLLAAGYSHFVFSDEALSPVFLKHFSQQVLDKKLKLHWSCRCRIETAFTSEILDVMKQAGCYEILFGLESTSGRMLERMGKHEGGLDLEFVQQLFQQVDASGLGLHVTMINGFPGDTLEEAQHTVQFVSTALKGCRNATFKLNQFELFPDTPIFQNPEKFGLAVAPAPGDMPTRYHFHTAPGMFWETLRVLQAYPRLEQELYANLGWTDWIQQFSNTPSEAKQALYLYFHTGHGSVFKSQGVANPFSPCFFEAVTP